MKMSKFKKIFLISWAALLVVLSVALTVFGFFLNDFENNRPEKYCEELLNAYKTADCDVILPYFPEAPAAFGVDGVFEEYINKYLPAEELYYYEQSSATDEIKQYDFMVGSKKFATLKLAPTGEKSFFNQTCYSPVSFEEFPLFEYTVTFADGISVSADGSPIDSKFLTEPTTLTDSFTKIGMPEYRLNKYVIDEFTYIRDFAPVSDLATSRVDVSELEKEFYLSTSDTEAEELKAFCREFYKKYAVYVTLAYQKIAKVYPYLHEDSDIGAKLALVDNRYGEYPRSYTFENEVFSNLYRYSETDFSIDVKFDLVLVKRSSTRSCAFNGKIFVSMTDDGFKVVDMKMISE